MRRLPAPPEDRERWEIDIELRLETLEKSRTNSPSFWRRAWAITGHTWAVTGVIYAGLIVVGLFIGAIAGDASAHSTCSANPKKPERTGYQNNMIFSSRYGCQNQQFHDIVWSSVIAQRRTPGQAWETIGSNQDSVPNTYFNWVYFGYGSFNCNKDYRAIGGGSASPGGHANSGVTSGILFHTC